MTLKPLRPLAAYVARLHLWFRAASEVRFVSSPSGRNALLKSLLLAPISSLRGLAEFRPLVLLEDAVVSVRGIGRFQVRAHTDDLYVVVPSAQPDVLQVIRSQLRPGDVFVDAGANIGVYTILASRLVGSDGAVVAIEMMPDTFAQLQANVLMNPCRNISLVNRALADTAGRTIKVRVPDEGRHGKASIVSNHAESDAGTVEVVTATLDAILESIPQIRLLKLDIEGAEQLAIQGAGEALDRIESIVFESWDDDHDASALLAGRGFRVRPIGSRNFLAARHG